jgi:hypothetical protein
MVCCGNVRNLLFSTSSKRPTPTRKDMAEEDRRAARRAYAARRYQEKKLLKKK